MALPKRDMYEELISECRGLWSVWRLRYQEVLQWYLIYRDFLIRVIQPSTRAEISIYFSHMSVLCVRAIIAELGSRLSSFPNPARFWPICQCNHFANASSFLLVFQSCNILSAVPPFLF